MKAGGEGDDRGCNGWMASPTQWTWVWASFRSWWWTGKPDVLQPIVLQRIRHELNWTELLLWDRSHWTEEGCRSDFCSNRVPKTTVCHGSLCLGWKRISRHRVFQKGVSLGCFKWTAPTFWQVRESQQFLWVSSQFLSEKAMATHSSLFPGKSHGQRSLVGCHLWGHTESDRTEVT